jgi:hypothetical protein
MQAPDDRSTWQRSELIVSFNPVLPQFFQEQGSTFVLLIGRWSHYKCRRYVVQTSFLPFPPFPPLSLLAADLVKPRKGQHSHAMPTTYPLQFANSHHKKSNDRILEISFQRHRKNP